jgi:hypothetical protein
VHNLGVQEFIVVFVLAVVLIGRRRKGRGSALTTAK